MIVKLYITQIIPNIPIYHVGLGFQSKTKESRFDFHPKQCRVFNRFSKNKTKQINLGSTFKKENEIKEFEKLLNKNYFLFFNDCRHYCQHIIKFSGLSHLTLTNPFYLNSLYQSLDHNID